MPAPASVLIVGGGLGGFTTAQELRRHGFSGSITLIDPEGVPYDRPPLSKGYLAGDVPAEKLDFAASAWFADNDVTLVQAKAVALDAEAGAVSLDNGETLTGDVVVLATGGHPRPLPIPGGDLDGLHVLRTKAHADQLRPLLTAGKHLVIIGGGLIGAETASTAVKAGAQVTLVDPVEVPIVPAVGLALAVELHGMHAEHGVNVIMGSPTAIEKTDAGFRVVVDEGVEHGGYDLDADAVLLAIGIVPSVELAAAAGLAVENGVLVDAAQRTSHPRVYAVGDSSRIRLADGTKLHRHEHWDSAVQSGQRAAASIAGVDAPGGQAAWFWSDRYGHHVEGCGSLLTGHIVVREVDNRPAMEFRVADDGTLLGASAIDGGTAIKAARRMIDRRIVVDPEKLADASVDLKKLAK